jgi:apolipoprotein N-acyltransferase
MAHPRWFAVVLGALAACGFQPFALWPLTLLALAALIELVARAPTARAAALIGWLFGVAHFSLGNNWIAAAFTYQANMPAWLGGIAVVLLSLYLAVYPLAGGARRLADRATRHRPGVYRTGLRRLLDRQRMAARLVFTGFAWNPLGMVTLGGFSRPGLAALAPWLGTYALSGWSRCSPAAGSWPCASSGPTCAPRASRCCRSACSCCPTSARTTGRVTFPSR